MGSLLALLIIVVVSLLIVRIGTNALMLTGVPFEVAKFQAASAFFGVGFTTNETEMIVGHEVRRKIVFHLFIAGNVGLTSAMATLIVTFVNSSGDGSQVLGMLGMIAGGVVLLYLISHSGFIKKPLDTLMRFSLERAGLVRALDYELLLNVEDGYCISDIKIEKGHPFEGKPLMGSRPSDHGLVVLGIHRVDAGFIGAPGKDDVIHEGDTIMVYGSEDSVDKMAHPEQ